MKTSFTNPASWVPDDYGQYWRNCSTRRLIEQGAPKHPPVRRWLPKETRWQFLVHTQGLDGSIRRLDALKGSTDVRGNGRAWALLLALPPDRVWRVARLFTLYSHPAPATRKAAGFAAWLARGEAGELRPEATGRTRRIGSCTKADTENRKKERRRMKSKNNTTPAERGTIYTLGYSKPEAAAQLSRLMRNPRALLVDVRFQPLSGRSPQWNRAALSARFGKRYIWEQRLGNSQYRSRHLDIQLSAGYQDAIREAVVLLCSGTSLVLLCTCADERACHRSYVAKLIQDDLPVPLAAREVCG